MAILPRLLVHARLPPVNLHWPTPSRSFRPSIVTELHRPLPPVNSAGDIWASFNIISLQLPQKCRVMMYKSVILAWRGLGEDLNQSYSQLWWLWENDFFGSGFSEEGYFHYLRGSGFFILDDNTAIKACHLVFQSLIPNRVPDTLIPALRWPRYWGGWMSGRLSVEGGEKGGWVEGGENPRWRFNTWLAVRYW